MSFFASLTIYPALACAVFYLDQPVKLDFVWAGFCLMGAVNFIFRG